MALSKRIRMVVAGHKDSILADLLQHVVDERLPMDVVARTTNRADLPALRHEHRADLVLLCERDAMDAAAMESLRADLGSAAMVVVNGRGRSVVSWVHEPGLPDVLLLLAAASGVATLPGAISGRDG